MAKARDWRVSGMSLTDICERLKLSKSTVYYWIRDLPKIGRTEKQSEAQKQGTRALIRKCAKERQRRYCVAQEMIRDLSCERGFREFVILYLTEGYRRSRNTVAVANSNVSLVRLALRWLERFTSRPVFFDLQYHADQNESGLRDFWGRELRIDPGKIRLQRKSNSGRMVHRNWRSEHGVLTVRTHDTGLRSMIQAWMDWLVTEIDRA